MPTHYETLGGPPEADAETIRRAYVALVKANHPIAARLATMPVGPRPGGAGLVGEHGLQRLRRSRRGTEGVDVAEGTAGEDRPTTVEVAGRAQTHVRRNETTGSVHGR